MLILALSCLKGVWMAKTIRMPTVDELPPGPRRRFMEILYRLWSEAGMPPATEVSQLVANTDVAGSASKETIRKMLSGETVPKAWGNAEAVFVVLSQMAQVDPDRLVLYHGDVEDFDPEPEPEAARAVFRRLWTAAKGVAKYAHGTMQDYTPPPKRGAWNNNPWSSSDAPPF